MDTRTPSSTGDPGDAPKKVEISGLGKAFGSVTALWNASLYAREGEVTAIVGDNGAGKSTLIKCLAGYHLPDSGTILVDGAEVRFSSAQQARQAGIETVYQDLALTDQLSVWQNVFLNRELVRRVGPVAFTRRGEMKRRARELVEGLAVNVPGVTRTVKQLSGGQRQAVAIARSVMWSKSLVIMDEPTAALGLRETKQVEDLIRRTTDQGTTVIVISHNFEQVMRLSSQVWVMRGGTVVSGARTRDVTEAELVARVTGALPAD